MATKAKHPQNEADIIFNRANIALARSQRLIQSWLGPDTAAEERSKTEEELQKEDQELFKAEPETLGVGAAPRTEDERGFGIKRKSPSNDKLLEQLLGMKAARSHMASKAKPATTTLGATTPDRSIPHDDDDEEEGRASLIKSKKPVKRKHEPESGVDGSDDTQTDSKSRRKTSEKSRPQSTSYLDDVLAAKSRKSKKKTKE